MAPRETAPSPDTTLNEAVILVTPYSTGCVVGLEMQQRGYKLICVWSRGLSEKMRLHVPQTCGGKLRYDAELDQANTLEETAACVQEIAARNHWTIASCVCGGEAGVDFADALSEYMGLVTNGTDIANRRDQKVQQELVRATGLRAVRQSAGSKFGDVQEFLETESYPLIVKPVDSAGSDGVKLCRTYEKAKEHVLSLLVYEKVNGGICSEVVCQEFLRGKEYVVETAPTRP
jgi:biotin carboxylase